MNVEEFPPTANRVVLGQGPSIALFQPTSGPDNTILRILSLLSLCSLLVQQPFSLRSTHTLSSAHLQQVYGQRGWCGSNLGATVRVGGHQVTACSSCAIFSVSSCTPQRHSSHRNLPDQVSSFFQRGVMMREWALMAVVSNSRCEGCGASEEAMRMSISQSLAAAHWKVIALKYKLAARTAGIHVGGLSGARVCSTSGCQ